ncbi:hemolysin family protein [Rhizomicrobium electricum]|jgi:putative hemolysin|uniref:Hemolysin family protein n=1 Tax=Rhizomicrobium electricum TaxID=480070 RepID=A0ABP3PUI1_9PROT|nr:hemolysin family protein [Rhizomicrobium electricum]NIJ50049.1 putative hemolysin [Rhizomicrobium electricum]
MLILELAVVAFLIVLNGVLAMSELAIVSSRRTKLKSFADRRIAGSRRALELADNPGRFLSTVQIGITLVGVLSGAFSGATLGLKLTAWLMAKGLPEAAADALGVGTVVAGITYLSLIAGELVPKQIALSDPERIAVRVAPAMIVLQKIASPLVSLLDMSGALVLRLMGQRRTKREGPTDDEIKALIAEAESAGVLEADERRMISGVMRLGDRQARGVMTPRTDVAWIDTGMPPEEVRRLAVSTPFTRLPAGPGIDELSGVIRIHELLAAYLSGKPFEMGKLIRPAPVVYDQADALDVLALLRTAAVPMALVHDEYGHFEGVVTPANIMEAIAGSHGGPSGDDGAVRREDGSWLIAGDLNVDEMADIVGFPLPAHRDYQTAAGFVLSLARHLPTTGEVFVSQGWRFEIVDMDGRRIDKVLASRLP